MSASGPEISADWSRRTERLGLLRFGSPGAEKPGVVVPPADDRDELGPLRPGAVVLDVSSWISAYDEAFFGGGGVADLRRRVAEDAAALPVIDAAAARFGAPIARPSKLIGIGLNYRAHAEETASALPDDPKLF